MSNNFEEKKEFKEKLLEFLRKNKIKIFFLTISVLISIILFFLYQMNLEKKNEKISEQYIQAGIMLALNNNKESKKIYEDIILSKNKFYSILSLNTILEKNLEEDKNKILYYFSVLESLNLSIEQQNLIKFKKSLYFIKIFEKDKGFKLLKDLIESNSKLKSLAKEIISD